MWNLKMFIKTDNYRKENKQEQSLIEEIADIGIRGISALFASNFYQ